jgi:Family of unknown function (DUF6445)
VQKPVFNPDAVVRVVNFDDQHFCLVIDDALLEPDRLVQFASARCDEFRAVNFSLYPGTYLIAPDELEQSLTELFRYQVRSHFDARRCVTALCRFSMVTLSPPALTPIQWICHRDNTSLEAGLSMQASVLYLFHDQNLGGTGFYTPTRSAIEIATLFSDAKQLEPQAFSAKYGIHAGYMRQSNDYFRRLGGVEAKWNRLIFYDGGMLHSSDIPAPDRLTTDPLSGRLTLNGFFTCSRNLT